MAKLILKKGEEGFAVGITILDSDGNPYDLTGKTLTMKMWVPGATSTTATASCTIIDAVAGTCQFTTEDTNMTKTEGTYEAEVELTESGVVLNTQTFTLWVKGSL